MEIIYINPENVAFPPRDVRRYRNSKWFEAFLAQVKRRGVVDPIVVYRPADFEQTGVYQLVDGWTRLLAARMAKLKSIPALVLDNPPEDLYAEIGYRNVWQQSLDPISMAYYAEHIVKKHMGNFTEAAAELCISERHLRRLLSLLSLPEDIKLQIARGERPAFTEGLESGSVGHHVKQRRKRGGSGQRCVICGRWPEDGKRKWILFCADHEDEFSAVMDYIMRRGWTEELRKR